MEKLNFDPSKEHSLEAAGWSLEREAILFNALRKKLYHLSTINLVELVQEFIYTFSNNYTDTVAIAIFVTQACQSLTAEYERAPLREVPSRPNIGKTAQAFLKEHLKNVPKLDSLQASIVYYIENHAKCDTCDRNGVCDLQDKYKEIMTSRENTPKV